MTPEQRTFLDELEADLASPYPAKQLGLGNAGSLTLKDATEALTQTISLISQLPLDIEHKSRLIEKSQAAYQSLLQELSTSNQTPSYDLYSALSKEDHAEHANHVATVSAGKVLLTLLGGVVGLLWSIPRLNFTVSERYTPPGLSNVIAFLCGGAVVWFGLSLVQGVLRPKGVSPRSSEGSWLAAVLGIWMCLVAIHQTWTAFAYTEWFAGSSYSAFERIHNQGIFKGNDTLIAIGIATFLLNSLVCVLVDKLLAAGSVSAIIRVLTGLAIFVGLPLIYGQSFYSIFNSTDEVRDAVLISSALPLVSFLVVPIVTGNWGKGRGLVSKQQAQLSWFLASVSLFSMLAAVLANPFSRAATVTDRLPVIYDGHLAESVAGEWLYELSRDYSGPDDQKQREEAQRDEALRTLLSKVDDISSVRWPKHAEPFDYNSNGNGTWYRQSAVEILRENGITGPVRD